MVYRFSIPVQHRLHVVGKAAFIGLLALALAGCQLGPTVASKRLIEPRAMIDFSGLAGVKQIEPVHATAAPPEKWDELKLTRTGPLVHQQWRSPSRNTGVGVAYVRMPLPLAARTLIWLARLEYTKKSTDGRIINEWTDHLGRPWFEAENNKYHLRGYAVTRGFDAWFIYFGYKTNSPPDPAELNLAARAMQTIVPRDGEAKSTVVDSTQMTRTTTTAQ
jgi:hypothetical protein